MEGWKDGGRRAGRVLNCSKEERDREDLLLLGDGRGRVGVRIYSSDAAGLEMEDGRKEEFQSEQWGATFVHMWSRPRRARSGSQSFWAPTKLDPYRGGQRRVPAARVMSPMVDALERSTG